MCVSVCGVYVVCVCVCARVSGEGFDLCHGKEEGGRGQLTDGCGQLEIENKSQREENREGGCTVSFGKGDCKANK